MHCVALLSRVGTLLCSITLITVFVLLLASCAPFQNKTSNGTAESAASLAASKSGQDHALTDKSVNELLTTGNILLENRNLELAKLHFATALEKDPGLADAYTGLGKISMHSGNYSAALDYFTRAAAMDNANLDAIVGQAQALRFDGKMNAAVKKINEAMALAPNDINVLKELAILYDLMGHENLAGPIYKEIVSMQPDVAAHHNNLGMNQLIQKKYPEAILSFLQALNINRDSIRIKNNLATAYALNGEADKALKVFTDTVGEAAAHNNLGYLYMTQGRFTLAEDHLKKALNLNPSFYQKAHDNMDKLRQLRKTEH